MATDMRAKLVVEAQATGDEQIEQLAEALEGMAGAGGKAAPRLQLLAAEMRALAQQQGLIDQFASLKTQTADYARAAGQAQAATRESALALKALQQAQRQTQEAEQALATRLQAARLAHQQTGQALKDARRELRQLGAESKRAGADTAVLQGRMADVRGQITALGGAYREAGAGVKALAVEQRQAAQSSRQIAADVKTAEAAFGRNRAAAAAANKAYEDGRAGLQRLRDDMTAAGVSSGNLAEAQARVRREVGEVRRWVDQVGPAWQGAGRQAVSAAAAQQTSARKMAEKVRSISKELALVRKLYVGVQAAMGAAGAARGLAATADEANNLQARLKLATGEGQLFDEMWGKVAATALRTNSALAGTSDLFTRITTVGRDAGLSTRQATEQALEITETINQAVQLSGASAAASDAALTQLIQGLQAGVLRGEEFNSVVEQSPRLARALADGLKVTVGELRAMAQSGKLTADVVIAALKSQAGTLREEFGGLPQTIGRSVQNLSTTWQLFVNEVDQGIGASRRIAEVIDLLAGNLDTVAAVAWRAGQVVAAMVAVKAIRAVYDLGAAALGSARAMDVMTASGTKAGAAINGAAAAQQRFAHIARGIGYALIADQVLQIGVAYAELRKQQQLQAGLSAEAARKDALRADKLKAISDATGVVVTSMRALDAAVAAGALVFDAAAGQWRSAAQAQQRLADAAQQTVDRLAGIDATQAVEAFAAMAAEGGKTEDALKQLVERLRFDDVASAAGFTRALQALGNAGRITAKEVGEAWQLALSRLDAGQIDTLRTKLQEAAGAGALSAQQLAQANEQILSASFQRLGVNAGQALDKIGDGAQEAIGAVGLVAGAAEAAGVQAGDAARAIELAFAAAVPKADSLQALDALQTQLNALGAAGKIGAEGVGRVQAALDRQRAAVEDQIPGIQGLGEALRQLGVKPQAELQALARKAREAFEAVKVSGTATPREINLAWRAMAEAAIAANDGVAESTIVAQAKQYGFAIQADEAGKAIVKSMAEAAAATRQAGSAADEAGARMRQAGSQGAEAADKTREAHERATKAIEFTWLSAAAQASKYRDEAAKHAEAMAGSLAKYLGPGMSWNMYIGAWNSYYGELRRLAEEYADSLERIDARQQALERRGSGAAKGVDDLRLRLLELNGTEEEIAQARARRERAEIERQIQLAQLEAERASVRGDAGASQRFAEEIELLREQLGLLGQIEQAEQRRRKERADARGDGADGGNRGGGGVGDGESTRGAPSFSITLNANGVNDPARLARLIEPELKKMARLAR